METIQIVSMIRQKYQTLQCRLNERTKRLWAATEAHALGRGGITIVQQAIGMDVKTIRKGLKEMNSPHVPLPPMNRSRTNGGGRKNLTEHYTDRVTKASPCCVHDVDVEPVRSMVSPNEGNEVRLDACQEVRAP